MVDGIGPEIKIAEGILDYLKNTFKIGGYDTKAFEDPIVMDISKNYISTILGTQRIEGNLSGLGEGVMKGLGVPVIGDERNLEDDI